MCKIVHFKAVAIGGERIGRLAPPQDSYRVMSPWQGSEQTQTKALQSLAKGWKTSELKKFWEKKLQEIKGKGRRMANKEQCL